MNNLIDYGPQVLQGLLTTAALALASVPGAFAIGLCVALLQLSGSDMLRRIAKAYVGIFRGVPELLILFFFYYGVPGTLSYLLGSQVEFSNFWIAVLALGAIAGAYTGEVLRAAVQAIPVGQWEAAAALGLRPALIWLKIIVPQAIRLATPPLGNVLLVLIKDTALASAIGAEELMRKSSIASGSTRSPFLFFGTAALIYLAVTIPILLWQERVEARQAAAT